MALSLSPEEERKLRAKVKKVQALLDHLEAIITDECDDDDLYVARTRLDNWLSENEWIEQH